MFRSLTMRRLTPLSLFVLLSLAVPGEAQAQAAPGGWTISVSFTPAWAGRDTLSGHTVGWNGSLEGTEFTVGIGRRGPADGSWGVHVVQKNVKDTSVSWVERDVQAVQSSAPAFRFEATTRRSLHQVVMRGVEFHWFQPFGTIKRRIQIGANVAGGLATCVGNSEDTTEFLYMAVDASSGVTIRTDTRYDVETRKASDVLHRIVPLFRAEVATLVALTPSIGVTFAAGLDNPGFGLRIGGVLRLGRR
jgi:hypothetical protein